MTLRIFSLTLLLILLTDHVHPSSSTVKSIFAHQSHLNFSLVFLVVKRGNEIFQLLKETKERVKHRTRMFPLIVRNSEKENIDF